jgi:two-component system response regulator NreC
MFIEGQIGRADGDSRTKVMIVDDRELFRDGMKMILEGSGGFEVVASAADAESAIRYANGHKPDLAVIGPFMIHPNLGADATGTGLGGSIEEVSERTKVLLVCASRDMRQLSAGLDAGAMGIVEMSAPAEELVAAARHLAVGEAHLPPAIALEMVRMSREHDDTALTDREEEMLSEIALGYTNTEIAGHLHLSVRTIEAHRSKIQDKLGVSSRAGLVRQALDRGLVY